MTQSILCCVTHCYFSLFCRQSTKHIKKNFDVLDSDISENRNVEYAVNDANENVVFSVAFQVDKITTQLQISHNNYISINLHICRGVDAIKLSLRARFQSKVERRTWVTYLNYIFPNLFTVEVHISKKKKNNMM